MLSMPHRGTKPAVGQFGTKEESEKLYHHVTMSQVKSIRAKILQYIFLYYFVTFRVSSGSNLVQALTSQI